MTPPAPSIHEKSYVATSDRQIAVGRQPIFDAKIDLIAYELLFRTHDDDKAVFEDGEWATARVFWNTFVEMGLEAVTEGKTAYVNVTPAFVLGECTSLFDKKRIALEIRCSDRIDNADFVKRIESLSRDGFKIVLDRYDGSEAALRLLPFASVAKIDVRKTEPTRLRALIDGLRVRPLKVVATHVESRAMFELARQIGFDWFQGWFLSEPEIIQKERVPADSVTRVRFLAMLNDPKAGIEDLEMIISQDLSLAYRLLRYINSSLFALPTKIESVRHALLLLGPRWVRAWANLVILSAVGDKKLEVFCVAMVRARMCELLAQAKGDKRPDVYHTAGLFSMLDVLIGRPMAETLALLPLSEDLRAAILEKKGPVGEALECAINYERFHWDVMHYQALPHAAVCKCYLDALKWTAQIRGTLKD